MDLKLVAAEALLEIHPCFFSHSIKQLVLPLSYQQSLSRCITCHRGLRSTVTWGKTH